MQDATPSPLRAATAAYCKVVAPTASGPKVRTGEGVTVAVVDTGVEKVAGADGASDVSHLLAAMQWTLSFKGHGIRPSTCGLGPTPRRPTT